MNSWKGMPIIKCKSCGLWYSSNHSKKHCDDYLQYLKKYGKPADKISFVKSNDNLVPVDLVRYDVTTLDKWVFSNE